jgi:hypothetical protein
MNSLDKQIGCVVVGACAALSSLVCDETTNAQTGNKKNTKETEQSLSLYKSESL